MCMCVNACARQRQRMYVYLTIYLYIYIHTHTYVRAHIHLHTHTLVRTYAHTHEFMACLPMCTHTLPRATQRHPPAKLVAHETPDALTSGRLRGLVLSCKVGQV